MQEIQGFRLALSGQAGLGVVRERLVNKLRTRCAVTEKEKLIAN